MCTNVHSLLIRLGVYVYLMRICVYSFALFANYYLLISHFFLSGVFKTAMWESHPVLNAIQILTLTRKVKQNSPFSIIAHSLTSFDKVLSYLYQHDLAKYLTCVFKLGYIVFYG